jgi:glycolate oxidase
VLLGLRHFVLNFHFLAVVLNPWYEFIMEKEKAKIRASTLKMAVALARRIGEHKVIDDPDILESFSDDESSCAPVMPDLAVRVEQADDVIATVEEAEKFSVPVTPRGSGTGKAGSAIPIYGGVVLDMLKMNRILDINRADLTAVVEPGCITGSFQNTVEQDGLFYPPDPNSLEDCSLGGNIAHNAGGPRAFKYGVTREYVMGVDVVLMGGACLSTGRRTIKSVAGYDLTGLFVGSEGTLGVFTKMMLRLISKPPEVATLLVRFKDEITAGRAVSRIIEQGLRPRVLEFMDETLVATLRLAGAGGIPQDTGALLLAELDGPSEQAVEGDVLLFADMCEKEQAIDVLMARHIGERDKLWAARRTLSDAIKKRAAYKIAEDIAVPRSKIASLLDGLNRLEAEHKVLIASYGHAGDGNFHVNVLWDDPEWDPEPVVEDIFRLALDLKGTITGEHGVGLAKKKYLPWEKDATSLGMQREMKKLFDPKGLMNPGKIFI